ncbi:MAG: hypothetical protein ACO1OO_09560 [Flavisolibacter sp.]
MRYLLPFLAVAFISCDSSNSKSDQIVSTDTIVEPFVVVDPDPVIKKPTGNWSYDEDEDKMDGSKSYYAICRSKNEVFFDFPYNGGSKMNIIVRKMDGLNEVLLTISHGQFSSAYSHGTGRIKYDDEKPMTYSYSEASSGSSDVIFLKPAKNIITKLKAATSVMVEAPFYDAGKRQFEFDVSGLRWEH